MCTCVGVLGPALGGGIGRFQGLHGLVTDQIISAKIVLASGEMVTVSETEHSDLYWGIRTSPFLFPIASYYNKQNANKENQAAPAQTSASSQK
jgi:hypothetical protein